jgi:hypothetical protein
MAQGSIYTFTIPRPRRYDPPRQYDLTVLPTLASSGGKARHEQVQRMSKEDQRALWTRVSVGTIRFNARRYGHPDPIFVEQPVKTLPGGGCVVDESKPAVALRREWGGDGRSYEDALKEAQQAKPRDNLYIANLRLAVIAEKHRKALKALGIEIVGEPGRSQGPAAQVPTQPDEKQHKKHQRKAG